MTTIDQHQLLRAFVDELVRCGLRDVVTSPGSRSAPLVLAFARDDRLRTHSVIDERVAGFYALGLAKATGRPAAVVCTSGTAATNYTPAVHEAHEARVPLLVVTADRPAELRAVGAGQVIDQVHLYGRATRWFVELDLGGGDDARARWIRGTACRAWWATQDHKPGPVHVNVPLREPLVPDGPVDAATAGRDGAAPWVERVSAPVPPAPDALARLAGVILAGRRGVVVCGRHERHDALPDAVAGFAEATGYPVLADPLSGCRRSGCAVAHYDALLRGPFADANRPEVVFRVGDLPTSKPLRAWLAASGALDVAFDAEGAFQDPDGAVSLSLPADPATTLAELTERVAGAGHADAAWTATWNDADARAAAAIDTALGDELSEPRVAADLPAALPPDAALVVASSMPVRDLETFAPACDPPLPVWSNRGANGIDGTVATAAGAAAGHAGPVALLIGDVALVHDAGGLLALARAQAPVVIVLLDNDGGGIFNFLPIATATDVFEEHVATPTSIDVAALCTAAGVKHVEIADRAGLRLELGAAIGSGQSTLLHVRTDRAENVALHRRVWDAVAEAL
jgi:2-succinyl-5-enolpyruvyl-6-hydroxy-3-cyclohexene-1-carboxylate synthase